MATRRGHNKYLKDVDLQVTRALPSAASTTVSSTGIDAQAKSTFGIFPPGMEALIEVPALNTTQLPDTKTLTVTVEASDSSSFAGTPDVLATLVFTGAGGVGAAADELRVGCGSNCKRYLRGKFVTGSATGDCSGVTATVSLVG